MTEEVFKAKKRRSKLQANIILNLNKPVDLAALEAVAAAVARDRADAGEDDDMSTKGKKRTRKRLTALERLHQDAAHPQPGHEAAGVHALAEGYEAALNQAVADETKSARDMSASATNARGSGTSAGDFAAQRAGRNGRRVAVGTPDLNQQPATVFQGVLARLRANPYNFIGGTGFGGAFAATDRRQMPQART